MSESITSANNGAGTSGIRRPALWLRMMPAFLGGLLYSVCMLGAMPPASWWPLALVAPAGLIWAAGRPGARARRDGIAGALGSLPFWLLTQSWMYPITEAGYLPACLLQCSYAGLFVAAVVLVRRGLKTTKLLASAPMVMVAPWAWVAVEWLRGEYVFAGYGWALLGHPLIDAGLLAAAGGVLGAYFVSNLACIPAAAGWDALIGRTRTPAIVAVIGAAAAVIGCAALHANVDRTGRSVDFGVVQTNVPQSNKVGWTPEQEIVDWREMVTLAIRAAGLKLDGTPDRDGSPRGKPDVLVWPETMIPGISIEPQALEVLKERQITFSVTIDGKTTRMPAGIFAEELMELSRRLELPMLVGEEARDGLRVVSSPEGIDIEQDARYNSVYLLNGGKIVGPRYDKMVLTPFGEVMPGISRWKWLEQKLLDLGARGLSFDLGAGTRLTRFEVPAREGAGTAFRAVAPICFEITASDLCRGLAYDGSTRRADVIANITNDGWFTFSNLTREQHLLAARWRALELGTPVVRSANTGISALIDRDGRVLQKTPAQTSGVLRGTLNLSPAPSVFARVAGRVGNIAGWLPFAATAGILVLTVRRWRSVAAA